MTLLQKHRPFSWTWLKMWCVAWWHSGREDEDDEDDIGGPESSKAGCEETLTPISAETPITATESRCPSLSVIQATSLPLDKVTATAVELNSDYKTTTRTAGNDSVCFTFFFLYINFIFQNLTKFYFSFSLVSILFSKNLPFFPPFVLNSTKYSIVFKILLKKTAKKNIFTPFVSMRENLTY